MCNCCGLASAQRQVESTSFVARLSQYLLCAPLGYLAVQNVGICHLSLAALHHQTQRFRPIRLRACAVPPLCFRRGAPTSVHLADVPGALPAISAIAAIRSATPLIARPQDGLTNVDPMSNQSDTQANTSPPASVRSKPQPGPSHGASSPSRATHDDLIPKTLAQTGRSKTASLAQVPSLWKSSVDRPQLSERDSIFATTYLVSDSPASSPRTSARSILLDNNATEQSPSDMAVPAPPQRRLIDAPVFRKKQSTHPPIALHDHTALLATHFNSRKPIAAGMVVDELHSSPPPYMSPVDFPVQRPTTPYRPDIEAALNERLESSEERAVNRAWREGKNVPFKGTGAADDLQSDNDVEKKIDVTLANIEQPSSARSRKASHYLRVFKDGGAVEEQKKKDLRAKERWNNEKALPALEEERHLKSTVEFSALSEQLQRLSRPSSNVQSPQTETVESYFEKIPTPGSDPVPPALANVDTSVAAEHGLKQKSPLPSHVLEEIRSIANLTPGAQPGSSLSRSLPTSAAERYHAHVSTVAARQPQEEPDDYFQSADHHPSDHSPGSEDEDSEREQISSALYFPHRRLKLTDPSSAEGEEAEAEVAGLPQRSSHYVGTEANRALPVVEREAPQEVEISLQSQDTNQYLHGDIPSNSLVQQEDARSLLATSADTLSVDSETESLAESTHSLLDYDSSATDDLGTTPTATTHKEINRVTQAAVPQPPAPLDAVELKPYNHQVGGHSTVYRFSRRAVCKQLNNRENEFYETVEREHPELLEFLPRYDYISAHSIVMLRFSEAARC